VNNSYTTISYRISSMFFATLLLCICPALANEHSADRQLPDGKSVYRFYCYQCHGYAGNAKTLASTYLNPAPRDFTTATEATLTAERMLKSIRDGRPGTAMVKFSSVLTAAEISAVVGYIRASLLGNPAADEKYHSPENGWPNHQKYSAAFPFIDGSTALDIPWADLSPEQRAGKHLYVSACVSCHDQPNASGGEAIWETRAVSFPRKHFSHRSPPLDAVSAASPYARHELKVVPVNMTDEESAGLILYSENCAFCHAPDGTGQNWIGSFLDPKPRDFTARTFVLTESPDAMRAIIKSGIANTSMPAWQHVLSDAEIDAIIAYISVAFRPDI
jgi:cytochrome c oxidase cbb3-type subunit 3